jgi:DNA-binding XRE family transcriptional regulator
MMCDAACPRCGKRYGWVGEPMTCPECPYCGYKPQKDGLMQDAEIVRGFREWLTERTDSHASKMPRTRLRHASGFSIGQAAVLLGVTRDVLVAIEAEIADPLPWLHRKMIQLYRMD